MLFSGTYSFPPWAGVARSSFSVRQLRALSRSVMDHLVRCRRNTNGVLRVKQLLAVLENVIFCYGVHVVDGDLWPYCLPIPQHPVRDRVVFAPQVTPHVPGNDPVSELPPLSRLVEVLVQPSVKPKGVSPYFPVQL